MRSVNFKNDNPKDKYYENPLNWIILHNQARILSMKKPEGSEASGFTIYPIQKLVNVLRFFVSFLCGQTCTICGFNNHKNYKSND